MASELDELIEFLSAPKLEVRKMAVEIVHGLTGSDEGIRQLARKGSDVGPALLHLLKDKKEIAKLAGEALVNLSQDPRVAMALIMRGALESSMELIGQSQCSVKRLLVMLLANLTQLEEGVERLLQEQDEKLTGLYVSRLVRYFTRSTNEETDEDEFEHVAAVLVNLTRQEAGRRLLLDADKGLLRQLLPQIESKSLVRRQGVAGTVRNCCFEAASALPSLLLTSQFLWPALLLPLAGSKPYNKQDRAKMPAELAAPLAHEREAEKDAQVRVEAADALYLIAMQEGGRRALWAVNAPRILQVGYEDEEDPKVMEAYERLGSLLVAEGGLEEEPPTDSPSS